MLDEYKDTQSIAYKMIINAVKKNRCSHAYLLETNGLIDKEDFAKAFAKYLLCPYNYLNNKQCVNCTQCNNIDKGIFEDLKVIKPDGLWIKKEQLLELQEEFKTKSVISGKKVYIITDASKLNDSSSNSILKFLEEPKENIIAILLADNVHQLLDTIVSRCQIIPLTNVLNDKNIENYISVKVEDINLILTTTLNFVKELETKKEKTILFTKKIFHNNIIEKNDLIASFEIMILYYKDALNKKLDRKTEIFNDINDKLLENSIEELNYKINKLIDLKGKIYINANTNLLIDKLIIELGGSHEDSRSTI